MALTLRVLSATVAGAPWTDELCPTRAQTSDHCEAISHHLPSCRSRLKREFTIIPGFSFCFRNQPSPVLDSERVGREGDSKSRAGPSVCETGPGGPNKLQSQRLSCSHGAPPCPLTYHRRTEARVYNSLGFPFSAVCFCLFIHGAGDCT